MFTKTIARRISNSNLATTIRQFREQRQQMRYIREFYDQWMERDRARPEETTMRKHSLMSEEEFDLLVGGYSPEDASHYAGVLMAAKARRRAIDSNGGRPMTEEEEDEQIDDFVRFLS